MGGGCGFIKDLITHIYLHVVDLEGLPVLLDNRYFLPLLIDFSHSPSYEYQMVCDIDHFSSWDWNSFDFGELDTFLDLLKQLHNWV